LRIRDCGLGIAVERAALRAREKERAPAKAITTSSAQPYEFPEEKIVVLLKERALQDVGVGGRLRVGRRSDRSGVVLLVRCGPCAGLRRWGWVMEEVCG